MDRWTKEWVDGWARAVEERFGDRIWFLGLQGSRARGDNTRDSDIDTVLVLDRAEGEDLLAYSALLDRLPRREKACGFVCGRRELEAWDPGELFQFCRDTLPLRGRLDPLLATVSREDIWRAVHRDACGAYHLCAHNLVHQKRGEALREACKAMGFALQAAVFLETGQYPENRRALLSRTSGEDRSLLEETAAVSLGCLSPGELAALSGKVLAWSSRWMAKAAGALGRI